MKKPRIYGCQHQNPAHGWFWVLEISDAALLCFTWEIARTAALRAWVLLPMATEVIQ